MDAFWVVLGFSILVCHEMDAVRAAEWRILPGLSRLGDEAGYRAFTLLHVPIYAVLLWYLMTGDDMVSGAVPVGLSVFYVVHAALHVLLRNLPENHFSGVLSWGLILGAAIAGGVHLGLAVL